MGMRPEVSTSLKETMTHMFTGTSPSPKTSQDQDRPLWSLAFLPYQRHIQEKSKSL